MKLCKMIEIYLKYDKMHKIRTINAFICINNHVYSCINRMLSNIKDILLMDDHVLIMTYESLATRYLKCHIYWIQHEVD